MLPRGGGVVEDVAVDVGDLQPHAQFAVHEDRAGVGEVQRWLPRPETKTTGNSRPLDLWMDMMRTTLEASERTGASP